jgi:hypothetical protein
MSDQYNGWTNRETWAANLWLTNSQASNEWIAQLIADYRVDAPNRDPVREGIWTQAECVRFDLADTLASHFDECWECVRNGDWNDEMLSMLQDVGSLWRVDWQEIAKNLTE